MQFFSREVTIYPRHPSRTKRIQQKTQGLLKNSRATVAAGSWSAGTQFTDFTSTKVQILTQEADLQVHPDPEQPPSSPQENSRIRPPESPTVDSTRRVTRISIRPADAPHIYSTRRGTRISSCKKRTLEFDPQSTRIRPAEAHRKHVAQSQPLITVAQSISGVENAQSMAEPARECLLNSCRTLQVNPPPLPNLLLI